MLMLLISSTVGVIIGILIMWPIIGWEFALSGAVIALPMTLAFNWARLTWSRLNNIERMLEELLGDDDGV